MIIDDEKWRNLLDRIKAASGGIIYVIGSNDTGKSTLCRWLAEHLSPDARTAYIDCDPGQSLVGPPTTIGLEPLFQLADRKLNPIFYFIGSTTPRGHLLQTLAGIRKLTDQAVTLGAKWIILDSCGFVLDPVAREFQFRVIDVLEPDYLLVFQRPEEDFRWINNFTRHPKIKLHRLSISPAVMPRTPTARRQYREEKFRKYFEAAIPQILELRGIGFHGRVPDLQNPARHRQLLIALCDAENFVITLGIVQLIDLMNKKIQFYAPQFDRTRVVFIQFGSLYLSLCGQQIHPQGCDESVHIDSCRPA